MPHPLSLDHATTPALSPLEVISLARELGCDAVALRRTPFAGHGAQPYDLGRDPGLCRRIRDEAAAQGIRVALVAGFQVQPGLNVADLQPAMEAAAAIGARHLSVVVYDPDRARHADLLGQVAERAGALGLRALIEFIAFAGVNSLPYSLELIRKLAHPALGLSIDALHVVRTGATPADVAAVPAGLIGHAQLCDGPARMPLEQQMDEAMGERLLPGEGEFDLAGLVRALPADVTIGVEASSRAAFARGVTMQAHGRAAVAALRRVVAQALQA